MIGELGAVGLIALRFFHPHTQTSFTHASMVSLVWLITGTSSGFGAEFVKSILARGDKVIATARNLSKIKHLESLGAAILEIDVSDTQDELDRKAEEAIQIYGTVDVLVNNAGYAHFGVMEEVR